MIREKFSWRRLFWKKKKKNNSLIKETNTALLLHETPLSFSSYSEDEHDNVLSYGKNLSEDKQEI